MQAFYSRYIHHLWSILDLEEAEQILKDESFTLIRHLSVRVTKDDLEVLQQYLKHQQHVYKVDEFLERAFRLEDPPLEETSHIVQSFVMFMTRIFEVGKKVEMWLYTLCIGFLLLAIWAVYLFIRDIQQELRWGRVLTMMMVIVFFICCLWHWRHMHKVAESRRQSQMMKRGYADIPEECMPGARGATANIFDWVKVTVFGSPDVCERYFEDIMIDPTEEITPAMVIAETLAKFFLQPLQHLGSEMAKLITNFYGNIPVVYHLSATILFVVLLVIVLFYLFGYGIDFPLWMGGIRPVYRTDSADTSQTDRITREAIAQLNQDRERFLQESRTMLTDITRAAISTQSQMGGIQPLMFTSSSILENQLEHLISTKLANLIPTGGITSMAAVQPPPGNQETTHNDSGVFTVTSTPLRNDLSQDNMEVKTSLEVVARDKKEDPKALNISTDVIHYRLTGSPRKKVLSLRQESCSSKSPVPSETSSTVSLYKPGDRQVEQHCPSSVSINRVRRNSSSSAQSHSSSESVNENYVEAPEDTPPPRGPDEPNHADTSTIDVTDEFFFQVKNVLEESINSSLNDSNVPGDIGDNIRRPNSGQEENLGECLDEVELSGSGVKFLKTVKNIMTP
ncbi:uncharacterized protein LOC121875702 [Homarus americanus]|uniref:uncharacterized protein LOC121875702 n=1 Tax=Homarus americanus TaxID=6706 RepID=UPI001C472F4D|nr:uncharacterized protein LOC121875702 [Homarus americanus]